MYLNFSDIPGHNNLFLDYVYDYEQVANYFLKDFRASTKFEEHFEETLSKYKLGREKLNHLVSKQYEDIECSQLTRNNINLLQSPKTLAVVTGQQLGILGGPLYTFYKIITTIKLARQMADEYKNYNFVPVFWLEGDDHDFDEIRLVNIFGEDNSLTSIAYDDGMDVDENRGSVGIKNIDDNIEDFFNTLITKTRKTDFTGELVSKLKDAYFSGTSFKDAFFDLLHSIFDKYGIIFFDPADSTVKKELSPVFKQELMNYRKHTDALVLRSAELEETYHAQVKVRPINLFLIENKERLAIEPDENGYKLKGKRTKLTYDELLNILGERPDKISPNVILRPICQDYLLPTAFYVGGPGEISYFAQIMAIYDFFDISAPIIYPRSAATIVEKNIAGILEKYKLSLSDMFKDPHDLKNQIVQNLSEFDLESLFSNTDKEIEKILGELQSKIIKIDPSIEGLVEKTKQRIVQSTSALKDKTLNADKRRFDTALRQLDKATSMLYPNKNLQEREINYFYFANKYGNDFLEKIFNNLAINKFEHQIIEL